MATYYFHNTAGSQSYLNSANWYTGTGGTGSNGNTPVWGTDTVFIDSGQTIDQIPVGSGNYVTNNGTITVSNGPVSINNGTVVTNNGGITANHGPVTISNGGIGVNYPGGIVATNASSSTVTLNHAAVTLNNGTVGNNQGDGTVGTNNGTIGTHWGLLTTNSSGGIVTYNYTGATITNNYGTITNASGGTVTNNYTGIALYFYNTSGSQAYNNSANWYQGPGQTNVFNGQTPNWATNPVTIVAGQTINQIPAGNTNTVTNNGTISNNLGTVTNASGGTVISVNGAGTVTNSTGGNLGFQWTTFTQHKAYCGTVPLPSRTTLGPKRVLFRDGGGNLVAPTAKLAVPYVNGVLSTTLTPTFYLESTGVPRLSMALTGCAKGMRSRSTWRPLSPVW